MVTERELREAIRECESAPASLQSLEKLAVFYTVYDKKFADNTESSEKPTKSIDVQPISDSEFMRLLVGKDWTSILVILDELMDTVKILQPRLYEAVMRKLRE